MLDEVKNTMVSFGVNFISKIKKQTTFFSNTSFYIKTYIEDLFKFAKGFVKLFHYMNAVVKLFNRHIRDCNLIHIW